MIYCSKRESEGGGKEERERISEDREGGGKEGKVNVVKKGKKE